MGSLWLSLGFPWGPFGSLWGSLGVPFGVRGVNVHKPFWELETGATGAAAAGEVVARPAARIPHPTRAGGQDDGSYTNSLK